VKTEINACRTIELLVQLNNDFVVNCALWNKP